MHLSQNVATVEANLLVSHVSSCLKFHLIYSRSCFAQGLDVVAKSANFAVIYMLFRVLMVWLET